MRIVIEIDNDELANDILLVGGANQPTDVHIQLSNDGYVRVPGGGIVGEWEIGGL